MAAPVKTFVTTDKSACCSTSKRGLGYTAAMNARLRPLIALLLLLSFGLALPSVHGQQLMVHRDAAEPLSAQDHLSPQAPSSKLNSPAAPCHSAAVITANNPDANGCDQCGGDSCQCQLISLSPALTPLPPLCVKRCPIFNDVISATTPSRGQLCYPWRPPSNNA